MYLVHSEGVDEYVRDGVNAFCAEKAPQSVADVIDIVLATKETKDLSKGQRITVEEYSPCRILPALMNLIL